MRIDFPKILKEVPLSEYAPEVKTVVTVWVNPTQKLLESLAVTFQAYVDSEGKEGLNAFLAPLSELLSQGEEATHWTVDELNQMITGTIDTDPLFFLWFQNRVLQAVNEHRLQIKKA